MPLDGITTSYLAEELDNTLTGGRIDRIRQPGRYDILLTVRAGGRNHRLLLSANPAAPRAQLTSANPSVPPTAPRFCMILRKHLQGARIESIRSAGYERVLRLAFSTVDEIGDRRSPELILEIMGRHSNLILINHEGIILDAIRHVDLSMSRLREVMPARPYLPPPAQNKLAPQTALTALMDRSFFHHPTDTDPGKARLDHWLLDRLQGWSRQLVRELLERAGLSGNERLARLTDTERARLEQELRELLAEILAARFEPSLYAQNRRPDGRLSELTDFHALPLRHLGHREAQPTLSVAMERYYNERESEERLTQKRTELERQVRRRLERAARREAIHRSDVESSRDHERERELAELLTANLWRLKGGESELVVDDYFDPDLSPVSISLDPHRSPAWNSQRRFREYRRLRERHARASEALAIDLDELAYGASVLETLADAETEAELAVIRSELKDEGWLTEEPQSSPAKGGFHARKEARRRGAKAVEDSSRPLPPRSYRTSSGFEILVGRNNTQNDRLTLRTARPDDYWFHVRNSPGSHVILRSGGQEPDSQSLIEAAEIAAWFSRDAAPLRRHAGTSQTTPDSSSAIVVDYCPRSHVHKPRGARPGMVIYEGHRSLRVRPRDPADRQVSDQIPPDTEF
ncbi:MAG: NFACT RNA binding domain-containing protein [Bacillota bacterium]|nr:NFACT RNA binding domain-containing protein [Bacillota bacterium]